MKIYPKNLTNVERLSDVFGTQYGSRLEPIIAKEPDFTYKAFLTQVGTDAPVAQVLYSNFETEPLFVYNASGDYSVFYPLISAKKTIVSINNANVSAPGNQAAAYVRGDGEILVKTGTLDFTAQADDLLLDTFFQIEIWL